MATKIIATSIRLEPSLKQNAVEILQELGLTVTQAVNLFFRQVVLHKGLPFRVTLPLMISREALKDALRDRDLASYASVEELFEDLRI